MTHDPTLHAWLKDADAPGPTGPDDTSYDVALSELEDLVARVREDERAAALRDARDAIAAIPHWDEDSGESLFRACDKGNALAAIDALRGEA